jgi:hypothetical protein
MDNLGRIAQRVSVGPTTGELTKFKSGDWQP